MLIFDKILKALQVNVNERGFEIVSPALVQVSAVDVSVQILVTTQQQNMRRLDPTIHCTKNDHIMISISKNYFVYFSFRSNQWNTRHVK
jgi:hypothetical protein